MIVHPLEEKDKNIFLKLCENFYNSNATIRKYDESIANKTLEYLLSKHENIWCYLLFDEQINENVGYALITSYWCNEDGGNVIILDELYLEPVDRHKGLGKQFLEWIEKEFRDKAVSISLEVLTTNTIAKELYTKLGYKKDGFEVLSKPLQQRQ